MRRAGATLHAFGIGEACARARAAVAMDHPLAAAVAAVFGALQVSPYIPLPAEAADAMVAAIRGGQTHYTPAAGTMEVRRTGSLGPGVGLPGCGCAGARGCRRGPPAELSAAPLGGGGTARSCAARACMHVCVCVYVCVCAHVCVRMFMCAFAYSHLVWAWFDPIGCCATSIFVFACAFVFG